MNWYIPYGGQLRNIYQDYKLPTVPAIPLLGVFPIDGPAYVFMLDDI